MKKLVIANWKMNGDLNKINADLGYYANLPDTNGSNVILALPYIYIVWAKQRLLVNSQIKLAAQDLSHYRNCGAYTGKINGEMLKDAGVEYVIIGHSERRSLIGENGPILIHKVRNAFDSNLTPIFCVGEPLSARSDGSYLQFIELQLSGLEDIQNFKDIIIAYEPCWSIGTGKLPTLAEIQEVTNFINQYMQKRFGYVKISVLYGGSVTGQNARDILSLNGLGGVLVGGSSLKVDDFVAICSKA
ncbi:MAG: triose-phosphate isomerase [Proteobacteria bacterium]|nr:MAG: triose-phosphate isomerase [Pseudomonadota bacterium]